MYPKPIKRLIDAFSKLPGVGSRTATRFALFLLNSPKSRSKELSDAITEVTEKISQCNFCFRSLEKGEELCSICKDNSRNSILSIVERETDLVSLESIKAFKGVYFILGGNISPLKKEDLSNVRIKELKDRIKNPKKYGKDIKEVIIATSPTTEGEATALYLERVLKPLEIKVTKLAKGLPVGGELEYADEETLSSAFKGRN